MEQQGDGGGELTSMAAGQLWQSKQYCGWFWNFRWIYPRKINFCLKESSYDEWIEYVKVKGKVANYNSEHCWRQIEWIGYQVHLSDLAVLAAEVLHSTECSPSSLLLAKKNFFSLVCWSVCLSKRLFWGGWKSLKTCRNAKKIKIFVCLFVCLLQFSCG